MLIVRMEREDGTGMYRTSGTYAFRAVNDCDWDDGRRHPAPSEDSKLRPDYDRLYREGKAKDYYYGFASIKQMRRWIYNDDWFEPLQNAGVGIAVYETDDNFVGYTQVIFRKDTAKRVAFFPDIEEGIATLTESPIFKGKL